MSNPDDLLQEAREMAATWTEAHRLERTRYAYARIPMPETHEELCREANDTQYLDYARQTAVCFTAMQRSLVYRGNDYKGYAARFVTVLDAAIKHASTNKGET